MTPCIYGSALIILFALSHHFELLYVVVGEPVSLLEVSHGVKGHADERLPEDRKQVKAERDVGADRHRQELFEEISVYHN